MAGIAMPMKLRIAGVLIAAGLLVELVSLRWSHPLAFMLFLSGGGALIVGGVLFYLFSLVSLPRQRRSN
jgi:hypothetical protein